MALSTSMPMAMMKPASEVRLSPSPMRSIASSVPPMANSSELPTKRPDRAPIINIIRITTMATDSSRFSRKVLLAWAAMRFSA